MNKSLPSRLKAFMRSSRLVRFHSMLEKSVAHGYVLDVGPEFFLLALINDHIWPDGFECFRIADINRLRVDPYERFIEEALKKRGEKTGKPDINLQNIQELLLSAGRAFPLVTIHEEELNPDVCWIGRILEVTPEIVRMLEVGPDAVWDRKPTDHRLKDITHVNFGGDYEEALYLVAGEPGRTPVRRKR